MIDKKIIKIISFFITLAVSLLPFNFILGSKAAWFSCSSMAVPALGYQYSLLYVILYILTKGLFSFTTPFLFFLHRLPLFFATLSFKSRHWTTYILLPFLMMILFSIHPIGQQVFYYAWYWIIPMVIYVTKNDTIYTRALASSFITHSLGSVIWLYFGCVSVTMWSALIPVVIVERLVIAGGMILFTYLFEAINALVFKKITQKVFVS